jgi:hypothetical protein
MAESDNREAIDRWFKALNARRFDELRAFLSELVSPDATVEWPQSGERIRGAENLLATLQNYPGLPTIEIQNVLGAEDKWVLTPHWTPLRITGTGDDYTVESRLTYPNGEVWSAVTLVRLRKGKVAKVTEYFGAPFPAPEWRSKWVEKVEAQS